MGKIILNYSEKEVNYKVSSERILDCNSYFNVTILVPSGESRFISLNSNDSNGTPNISEEITSNTDYSLVISGLVDENDSLNTVFSTIVLQIKEYSSSVDNLSTKTFSREHSRVICNTST